MVFECCKTAIVVVTNIVVGFFRAFRYIFQRESFKVNHLDGRTLAVAKKRKRLPYKPHALLGRQCIEVHRSMIELRQIIKHSVRYKTDEPVSNSFG